MTPEVEAELVRLWNAGVSERRISQETGYSVSVIRAYACHNRDKCPYRHKRIDERVKEMWVERIRSGRYTVAQVSKALGVTKFSVRRWLKK